MSTTGFEVRTIADRLNELVRDLILSGEIAPGMPIRQDTLAAKLQVSKVPLREALARLEQDGLVISHPNRGYYVRTLSAHEAEEIFALRLKIEPIAAANACVNTNEAARTCARRALDALNAETADTGIRAGALNRAFHLALIDPERAPITAEIITRLHVLADRYVRKHLEPEDRNQRAAQEHQEILECWLAGKSDTVSALVSQHLQATLDDLRSQLHGPKAPNQ